MRIHHIPTACLGIMLVVCFVMALLTSGCTSYRREVTPAEREVNTGAIQARRSASSKTVQMLEGPYVGADPVRIHSSGSGSLPPVFATRVTLRATGTVEQLASAAMDLIPVRIRIEQEDGSKGRSADISGTLQRQEIAMRYDGSLRGYFDTLANKSGLDWEYDSQSAQVIFTNQITRTYTVLAAPGTVAYESTITNKAQNDGSSNTESVAGSSTSNEAQTAQSNSLAYKGDIWSECYETVQTLLTPAGRVAINAASGTVTVKDKPVAVHRVGQYIADLNLKLGRQIAYEVRVLALTLDDGHETGFDLSAVFANNSLGLAVANGSPYSLLDDTASLTATILGGGIDRFSGSQAIIRALRTYGQVTQLTSASGFAMNNQPTPVQVGADRTYLASVSTTVDNGVQSTDLNPGRLQEGFAMTVLPHILDRRRVILQYNIGLFSLDELREFSSGDSKVQLPQVSTRSFSQRVSMRLGQTLVLGGFEQETRKNSDGYGILAAGGSKQYGKTVIIVMLSVEDAGA